MTYFKPTLLALFLVLLIVPTTPLMADEGETFEFRHRTETPIGTSFPTVRSIRSRVPVDKPYSEFTAAQKSIVREDYELGPEDHPPFPADGLRSLYAPLMRTLDKIAEANPNPTSGSLMAVVHVDKMGTVTNVDFYKAPEWQDIRNALAFTLMKIRFEPGLRAGKPADTEYLIDVELASCDSSVQAHTASARCK